MFLFQPCSLGQCCFLYWSWYPGHALKVLGKYRARPYKRDKEEDKSSYWSIVVILVCGDGPLVLEVNWFMVAGIWHVGADWITRTCLEVRASHLQSWIFLHMCAYFFTDAWSMFVIGQIEWMRFIYESIDEYPQFNRPLCIENRHEFASCWLPGEFTGEDGWSKPIGLLSSQSLPLCYSSGRFPKRESCPVRGVWHLFEQLQLDTSLFSAMRNGWMQGIYARDVWSRSKGFLGHRQLLEEILE